MENEQPIANPAPAPVINPSNELMPPSKKWDLNTLLIIVAVLAVLVMTGLLLPRWYDPSRAIAQRAVDYLNANKNKYLQGQTVSLGKVSFAYGLVKFQVTLGGNSFDSYATRDGKWIFPQSIAIDGTKDPEPKAVDIGQVNLSNEPFIGAQNAPVVMAFWADYQCPFCKKTVTEVFPKLIKDYVDTGKMKVVFKDYAFLGADSFTLAKFARAVWEAAPAKYGAWHQAMYVNQGQENSGWATEAKIIEITTKAIGYADAQKALALFKKNGEAYQKLMDADKAEGTAFGVSGTPGTIIGKQFINGSESYDTFKAAIEKVLNGK